MAKKKKEKAVDLKPTNITDEQLKAIQELISPINNIQMELGRIETRKHALCHDVVELQRLQELVNLIQNQNEKQLEHLILTLHCYQFVLKCFLLS